MTATPATHRTELHHAERGLLEALDRPDSWRLEPSALPGWSRGHVVAHLLGNAEGLLNLTRWASTGSETPMYLSTEARQAAIEQRATWPLTRLREELATRAAELADACDALTEPLAGRQLRLGSGGAAQAWELPMLRIREVEIHRVDLADDYRPCDWSPTFTFRTMAQVHPVMVARGPLPFACLRATDTGRSWVCDSAGPDLTGREAELLAWLLGRPHDGLRVSSSNNPLGLNDHPVPQAPRWV